MTPYKSKTGKKSGVTGFKIGDDYIIVQFNHTATYMYSYAIEEQAVIEKMKALAVKQRGLSKFISQKNPNYIVVNPG
ncbi:MAG: hypothetical protein ABIN94_21610 [Ferruginibacter sp.]